VTKVPLTFSLSDLIASSADEYEYEYEYESEPCALNAVRLSLSYLAFLPFLSISFPSTSSSYRYGSATACILPICPSRFFLSAFPSVGGSGRTFRSDTRSFHAGTILRDNGEHPLLDGGHSVGENGSDRRAVVSSEGGRTVCHERCVQRVEVDWNMGRGSSSTGPPVQFHNVP